MCLDVEYCVPSHIIVNAVYRKGAALQRFPVVKRLFQEFAALSRLNLTELERRAGELQPVTS